MTIKKHHFTYFYHSTFYKRVKKVVIAGLFLTGNLMSTLPVMAAPTPSANIVVDMNAPVNQRPTLDVTHSGIDQINIVHPNDAGLSHNKFDQYNVNERGQILNNSPTITDTKLAGKITGNVNLKDGQSARLILNEVTGRSPTKLLGYTEVAGKQAAVIIANPTGITCAGCGFINTSRASLATGRPILDANGNLQSITVSGGEVGFDGKGGNFAEVPVLDIISRKVRIDAPVNGQDIRVVAGRNSYNYADGKATPLASDGSQPPEFAIDTSALGGMTGNHIQMLVNEKGAGVRVDGRMASTAGDMQLTADGKLIISSELSATNNMNARVDVVENNGVLGAKNAMSLTANSLSNTGKIVAEGGQESKIDINGPISNRGTIVANSHIFSLSTKGDLDNTNGQIGFNNETTKIDTHSGRIINTSGAILAAKNASSNNNQLIIHSGDIENSGGTIQATSGSINATIGNYTDAGKGVVYADKDLQITSTGDLTVGGALQSQNAFTIGANNLTLTNQSASISSLNGNGSLTIVKNLINNGNISFSNGSLALHTGSFGNYGAISIGTGGFNFDVQGDFSNRNGSLITDANDVSITAKGVVDNTSGQIGVKDTGNVTINSQNLINQNGGLIRTGTGNVVLNIQTLENQNGSILTNTGSIQVTATQDVQNALGKISVQKLGNITVNASSGDIDNHQGQIINQSGNVDLAAIHLNNSDQGQIGSLTNGNIALTLTNDLNNNTGKVITSSGDVIVHSGNFENTNGQLKTSSGNLTLNSGDIENSGGIIEATVGSINANMENYTDTDQGIIYAGKELQIAASGDMSVTKGIQSQGQLSLKANSLTLTKNTTLLNRASEIGQNNTITLTNGLINNGIISADQGDLNITAGSITNNNQINTKVGALTIIANKGDLSNSSSSILALNNNITLSATGNLDNTSGNIAVLGSEQGKAGSGNITISNVGNMLNNYKGLIQTGIGNAFLTANALNNTSGSILTTTGGVKIGATQNISNNSGKIGSQESGDVAITTIGDIDNSQGKMVTPNGSIVIEGNNFNNNSGQVGSNNGNVDFHVGGISNQNGTIIAGVNQAIVPTVNNTIGNLILNSGDIENSGGTIQATSGSINATIGNYTDTGKGVVYAGKNLQITSTGDLTVGGALQSQNAFTIGANNLTLTTQDASISALNGNGSLTIVKNLINKGNIYASIGNLAIAANSLENSGILYGKDFIHLNLDNLTNYQTIIQNNTIVGGAVQSDGNIQLTTSSLNNMGAIQSSAALQLTASSLINSGIIQSGDKQTLTLIAQSLQNKNGQILSDGDLNLTIQNELTNSGYLQAQKALNLQALSLNNAGNILALGGDLTIGSSQNTAIDNTNGKIQANGNITIGGSSYQSSETSLITAQQQLQANFSGNVVNNGKISGNSGITFNADSLSNAENGLIYSGAGNINLTALGQNGLSNQGTVQAIGDENQPSVKTSISVKASTLTNGGVFLSKDDLVFAVDQQFKNQRDQDSFGKIITQNGSLTIQAPSIENDGLIISPNDLKITTDKLINTGYVSADKDLTINATDSIVANAATSGLKFNGSELATGTFIGNNTQLSAKEIRNQSGWIQGNQALILTADTINNNAKENSDVQSVLYSTKGNVTLQGMGSTSTTTQPVTEVLNNGGNIQAYNRLWIAAQTLDNTNGILTSQTGDFRLDQGSSGTALKTFNNEGGTLQSGKDLTLSFSQLDSARGSKILAEGVLSLTVGSAFTNNGILWGGQGTSLVISSLVNSVNGVIGADSGNVIVHAKDGDVTNYGQIKNLDTKTGNLFIQAHSLTNDKGSILSNSNIQFKLSQDLSNQNGGEITAYNQGNIEFTSNTLNNSGLMLAGGAITGTVLGDINNNANGYIYGTKGVNLTSNTMITNIEDGQVGIDTGNLSLTAPQIILNKNGAFVAKNGNITLNASTSMVNQGWLQGMGDIQIKTPSMNNNTGVILSQDGQITIKGIAEGSGLTLLNNNNGIIQSAKDLTLYTDQLQNQNGKILTYSSLTNGATGDIYLYANPQEQALSTLDLSNGGILQASGNISLKALSSGLSSTGKVIAGQILNTEIDGDLTNNTIQFASLGTNQNSGVLLKVTGNYTTDENGGITTGGNLTIYAKNITNNGVFIAANDMNITTGALDNNVTGLFSSAKNMNIIARGNINNNQGVIQSSNGSIGIDATGYDVNNIGGLIRTQSQYGDITLTANNFMNKYSGEFGKTLLEKKIVAKYDTAINAEGQPYAGMTNKEVTNTYVNIYRNGKEAESLGQLYYASNVKILKVAAPDGLYTADGKPASGFVYYFLSYGAGNPKTRVEITALKTQTVLNGKSAIISAGGDLIIHTIGAIINNASHIESGRNMELTGASLENTGRQDSITFTVTCYNKDYCRTLDPKDPSQITNPFFGDFGGHNINTPTGRVWGSSSVNTGLSGSIVAAENLTGNFTGQVNNETIISNALNYKPTDPSQSIPSGKSVKTTDGIAGKDGLTGPGNSNLKSNGNEETTLAGKIDNLTYSGVTNPQGIDPGLHTSLPGFNGSNSTTTKDILSSLTGGQALFKVNPDFQNNNSGLNNVSGGAINGNTNTGNNSGNMPDVSRQASVNSGNINTTSVQPGSTYLIETRGQYTSEKQFYGTKYFADRVGLSGSPMFLGDDGLDAELIADRMLKATGQPFIGGTFKDASDSLKLGIDNGLDVIKTLGLQIGDPLTPEQQTTLDKDVVIYVKEIVDGKEVLVPTPYLSPKTAILSGAAIKGTNVDITAGSINNSGLMQGTNSIALTTTNGDISNIGGTIKGGNVSLNAQNGSVINSDTVNNYLVNGGTGSYLGSQGQILASGTLGIQASDAITTHGGTIQSGSDLAMKAKAIDLGTAQATAAASGVTYASNGTLKFQGNQTKNYGTNVQVGGNAFFTTTANDMLMTATSVNAVGSISLSSAGAIGLNAATNTSLSDVQGKKKGAFNSSAFRNRDASSNEIGTNMTSGGQINFGAQKDITFSGKYGATNDFNIVAKGSIHSKGLESTTEHYDSHKQSGIMGGIKGGLPSVGYGKSKTINASSSTSVEKTQLNAGKTLTMYAGQDVDMTATAIKSGDNTNISGTSVALRAAENKTDETHQRSSKFWGAGLGYLPFVNQLAIVGNVTSNKRQSEIKTTSHTISSIQSGGDTTVVARQEDINSFAAAILSEGNTSLIAKNDINLGVVTNTRSSNAHQDKSTMLQDKKVTNIPTQTEEIGSLVASKKDTTFMAGHNANMSGTFTGENLTLIAGNEIATSAMKNTTGLYYDKKTSGIGASFNGGMASIGYQSSKQKDTSQTISWTPSELSAQNKLVTFSGGSSTFTATNLSAQNDVDVSGSSVKFNTLQDTVNQEHKRSSIFAGVKVGLSSDSILGQVAQSAQAAADMSGKGSAAGQTLNAMQAGYMIGNAMANGWNNNGGLLSVSAQYGFNISKSRSEYTQSNVVGSSATAKNNLSIVARGDNANDKNNGDLTATAAKFAAKNIDLSGDNLTLQAGWNTTQNHSKGSSFGGAVGFEWGIIGGGEGPAVVANASGSSQHANGSSATAVNTTVTATDHLRMDASGKMTLSGAQGFGKRIDVTTKDLDVISSQNFSDYRSKTTQVGGSVKVPLPGSIGNWGLGGSYAQQNLNDHYRSTGDLSGFYAGNKGLGINASGQIYSKAGIFKSEGDASNSFLNTQKLITESQENYSKWKGTSTGGGFSLGSGMMGGSLGPLGMVAGNLAANSGLLSGNQRTSSDTSISQTGISSSVVVNAGSQEGHYTTDVKAADGYIGNHFDANKLANQLQNSQTGMQLVGEVMGQISDALRDHDVPTFGEGGFGRLALESGGSALIAAITGGNAGSAAASTAAGGFLSAQTRLLAQQVGKQLSNDPNMQVMIANSISNAFASGAGALTDAAMGGSGLNGAGLASVMQQYNQSNDPKGGKMDETTQQVEQALLHSLEATSLIPGGPGMAATGALAIIYASQGDYTDALLNLGALAIDPFTLGAGKDIAKGSVVASEEIEKLLGGNRDTKIDIITTSSDGTSTEQVIIGHGSKKTDNVTNDINDDLSLLDEQARQHILNGDGANKGGGHRFGTGKPGKTEFPESWSDQKIENTISDIVTDPKTVWGEPDKKGYVTTEVNREGINIRVVYDRNNNRIVTGYPTNTPKNPK